MLEKDMQEAAAGEGLSMPLAASYLSLYLGDPVVAGDWERHITVLYNGIKHKSDAVDFMRRAIACSCLLPLTDRTIFNKQAPENMLHKVRYFRQFEDRDWYRELQLVIKEDLEIAEHRKMIKSIGLIDPIELQPYTRQAYNWLHDKAEEVGDLTENTPKLLKNLVYVYGGAVVCAVFTNHQETVKNLLNWRTGYFFERAIYKAYEPDEIIRIKKQELSKTNPKLVKQIRAD